MEAFWHGRTIGLLLIEKHLLQGRCKEIYNLKSNLLLAFFPIFTLIIKHNLSMKCRFVPVYPQKSFGNLGYGKCNMDVMISKTKIKQHEYRKCSNCTHFPFKSVIYY